MGELAYQRSPLRHGDYVRYVGRGLFYKDFIGKVSALMPKAAIHEDMRGAFDDMVVVTFRGMLTTSIVDESELVKLEGLELAMALAEDVFKI